MKEKKRGAKGYINYLCIIFIIGIIILFFGNSISEKKSAKSIKTESEVCEPQVQIDEKKIENILSQIKGVGNVSVMITYENSGTASYLSDTTYENRSNMEESTKKTQKVVLSAGSPVVYEKSLPKVMGVVVVCDGAKNDYVKNNIVKAVCALTGVYEHKVGVFEKR